MRLEKDDQRRLVNEAFSEVLRERVVVSYEIESSGAEKDVDKEKLISNMFPSGIVEVCDE